MKTSDFYYDLPAELIAQDPLEDRASSRLLCLDRATGRWEHHVFREILDFLNPGDCLVINNTKVIPARLYGVREETGAVAVELENQAGTRRPADSRGIGVPTIRALLERNGGRMEITQQGNEYRTAVWLPKAAGASE